MSNFEVPQSEEEIPALAAQAIRNAVASAIAEGRSVLVTEGDVVYEVFPNGTKQLLTRIIPRTQVDPTFVRVLPQ